MDPIKFFRGLVAEQKRGIPAAVCSVCSSHPLVLRAAMADAEERNRFVLVESTVNQVNQDGGYTGMTPARFRTFIDQLAAEAGFPRDRILLGADHAGPTAWKDQPAELAMEKARVLAADLIAAGYSKIHLDASIPLPGDRVDPLRGMDPLLVAEREASMAAAAEATFSAKREDGVAAPVYVIGTDVPPPGGMKTDDEELPVTSAAEFDETVSACQAAFAQQKLAAAWQRVFAVVVNLGAEFGDQVVHPYDRVRTGPVCDAARKNAQLVLEGHSTDYQEPASLQQMVEDGVAVLKVGPALTFAMRESLFALELVEKELVGASQRSDLRHTLDRAMLENPVHWQSYSSGDDDERRLFRSYSWYDRCRYYWNVPAVVAALHRLMENLRRTVVPLTLLSQFCPAAFEKLRSGQLDWEPEAIVIDRIREVLQTYGEAGNRAPVQVEADE